MLQREIKILFFGALRPYEPASGLTVKAHSQMSAADLRYIIRSEFLRREIHVPEELFLASALGTESRVLQENDSIGDANSIALLPPVSGG